MLAALITRVLIKCLKPDAGAAANYSSYNQQQADPYGQQTAYSQQQPADPYGHQQQAANTYGQPSSYMQQPSAYNQQSYPYNQSGQQGTQPPSGEQSYPGYGAQQQQQQQAPQQAPQQGGAPPTYIGTLGEQPPVAGQQQPAQQSRAVVQQDGPGIVYTLQEQEGGASAPNTTKPSVPYQPQQSGAASGGSAMAHDTYPSAFDRTPSMQAARSNTPGALPQAGSSAGAGGADNKNRSLLEMLEAEGGDGGGGGSVVSGAGASMDGRKPSSGATSLEQLKASALQKHSSSGGATPSPQPQPPAPAPAGQQPPPAAGAPIGGGASYGSGHTPPPAGQIGVMGAAAAAPPQRQRNRRQPPPQQNNLMMTLSYVEPPAGKKPGAGAAGTPGTGGAPGGMPGMAPSAPAAPGTNVLPQAGAQAQSSSDQRKMPQPLNMMSTIMPQMGTAAPRPSMPARSGSGAGAPPPPPQGTGQGQAFGNSGMRGTPLAPGTLNNKPYFGAGSMPNATINAPGAAGRGGAWGGGGALGTTINAQQPAAQHTPTGSGADGLGQGMQNLQIVEGNEDDQARAQEQAMLRMEQAARHR